MSDSDGLLIDPTRAEIVEVLRAAAAEVRMTWPPRDLGAALIRIDGELEGECEWQGPDAVGRAFFVAWWHDYTGRKHLRVWSGPARDEEVEAPAALLDVYPERALSLWRDGRRTEVALCPCGAWGDPWSVGWTGDCCGPCLDRREVPGGPPLPFHFAAGGAVGVAVAPGGRYFAVLDGAERVGVWDVTEGRRTAEVTVGPGLLISLAVSPDSRFVGLARRRDGALALAAWDANQGRQLLDTPLLDSVGPAEVLVGQAVLFVAVPLVQGARLSRIDLPPRGALCELGEDLEPPALALSPDGKVLAALHARGGPLFLLDAAEGRQFSTPTLRGWQHTRAVFTADGRCVTLKERETYAVGLTWAGDHMQDAPDVWLRWPACGQVVELAFSPDSPTVAACDARGAVRVWRLPPSYSERADVLADGRSVSRCAFLADGRLLTFHPGRGVVNLWPAELFR
jgi:hypothetical protein